MKSKILPILIMIFGCFEMYGQDVENHYKFSLYSELSSHIRGNRSNNLTLEFSPGIIRYAIGFDHYYAIRSNIRRYQAGSFNYMLTGRIGITPGRDWKDMIAFGLSLKYGQYHLLEAEGRSIKNSGEVLTKDFNKVIPMAFFQFNTRNNLRYYFGFMVSGGYVFISNPVIKGSDIPETSFGYGDYVLKDQLEFGIPNSEEPDPEPVPVIQLNLCGFRF
ncbi:MAG: hypothetical protein R2769_16905 [Saprospiraceae bacterium]